MKRKEKTYEDMAHFYGRIWILLVLVMIFSYPIITCIYYDAWPGIMPVLRGLLGVALFWLFYLLSP